ncbi:hypothetical protein RFI_30767 [Reticulomyxa filosa]|uniref:Uncharacterized protein n=1 Tax=Reticulomyxa filosa TaxID=46433 RepID=X6M0W9_RETFI|nr:hypothetical protein RFI_30767 [Reticulomyxa filosa]|eukprot:ETO06625.1 hypothetical protein RFI_30767 [Reticulomyxa filosa]
MNNPLEIKNKNFDELQKDVIVTKCIQKKERVFYYYLLGWKKPTKDFFIDNGKKFDSGFMFSIVKIIISVIVFTTINIRMYFHKYKFTLHLKKLENFIIIKIIKPTTVNFSFQKFTKLIKD